jgi:hypothetical protein
MVQPESDPIRHKDEYPPDMQEAGEVLGLFNDDGTLKSFNQIIKESIENSDTNSWSLNSLVRRLKFE